MEIQYQNKHIEPYVYMPFLLPSQTQNAPNIKINDIGYKYYTLIMYDPDAVHGTYFHWIVTNIINTKNDIGKVILEYKGPNPPDVKQHRYIFQLYGSNQKWKDVLFESRNFSLEEAKKRLGINENAIIEYIFVSKREKNKKKGGTKTKKRTNKRRKYKRNKHTKRKYRLKYNK